MPSSGAGPSTGARIVRDSLVTLACRVASLAGALGLSVATARILGPEGRGIFALPTIDAAIATAMFVGLSGALSYLLTNQRAGRGAIRAVLFSAVPFVAVGSLLVLALGLIGGHTWATPFALASLPFAAIVAVAQGACYGTLRVRSANYLGLSLTLVTLAGTVGGFFIVARSPYVAIGAWLCAQAAVALAGSIVIARIARELPAAPARTTAALWFAARTGALNLVTLLNYRADVYIVALLTSPAVLGMYTLAVAGAEATQTATQALATTTAPHIGSLPPERARALTARAARNAIAIAIVACAVIAVIAPQLIGLLFGPRFAPVTIALRILLIGIVAMSASGVLANYITLALGKPQQALAIASGGATTSIVLSLLLVPRVGITGAAVAVSTSYVLSAIAYLVLFMRATEIPLRDIVIIRGADLRAYYGLVTRTLIHFRRIIAVPEGHP